MVDLGSINIVVGRGVTLLLCDELGNNGGDCVDVVVRIVAVVVGFSVVVVVVFGGLFPMRAAVEGAL